MERLDWREAALYVARDFEAGIRWLEPALEAPMAERKEPDDLDGRRRELEAALAARRPEKSTGESAKSNGSAGFGNALRLSSEFIAGIVVGAALGWFIDRAADTSPWGLIIFLLLGFGAGILNVLRSAGLIAEFGSKAPEKSDSDPRKR